MERHKCKICSRSFSNGRALGGHMRSHLATLPIPPKIHQQQLSDNTESDSSLSSSGEEERESTEEKALNYGLRENPKKSFRLVDPEFFDAGSVVHEDRESETESTRNTTRRRLKRTRKMGVAAEYNFQLKKKPKLRKPSSTESMAEIDQPASSVSDTSPEEDVALCLMMLSRDTWSSDDSDELKLSQTRGKYQCDKCNKVFRSFQALGGHRTSHKKIKNSIQDDEDELKQPKNDNTYNVDQRVYKCPFCSKVFGSGQALGGHKRSHLLSSSSTTDIATNTYKFGGESLVETSGAKFGESLIDLNQPAPMEDDEDYQSHQTCQN